MESGASLDKEGNLKVGSPLEMASMHYQQVASRIQEWKRTIESNPAKFGELELAVHEEGCSSKLRTLNPCIFVDQADVLRGWSGVISLGRRVQSSFPLRLSSTRFLPVVLPIAC